MFAAIHVPEFSLQCALRADYPAAGERCVAAAAALLSDDTSTNTGVVLGLNREAAKHGVCRGMTATQALARCSALRLLGRNPGQERVARDTLLQIAGGISPLIEETAPGLCTLDLRRRPRGAGGDEESEHRRWAEPARAGLRRAGLAARVGVARSPDLAALAAKLARPWLFLDAPEEFLHDQPLAVFDDLPAATSELLTLWGVRTLSAFAALPRADIARRLGAEALPWWDLANGRSAVRTLRLVRPPVVYAETGDFEHGVEVLEALVFTLHRFLERLVERLADAYLVVAMLELELGFADKTAHRRTFGIPAPTREVAVLERILLQHLECLRAPAPVVGLTLTATPAAPTGDQFGLLDGHGVTLRDPNRFGETLSRLGALVGDDAVGTPVVADTHRPDAFTIRPPDFSSSSASPVDRAGTQLFNTPGPALRRFRPPRPADVKLDEHGSPRAVAVNGASGACERRVLRSAGPWTASGQWWETAAAWRQQEWDVELAGNGLYRLAFDGTAWWSIGVYD